METTSTIEIAKRYTDNTYANKDEVRRGLNTSLVDPFWNAILSYRSQYSKPIRLQTSSMLSYYVCNTPTIIEKGNDCISRLARCLSTFIALDEGVKERVRYKCAYDSVAYVGQAYGETFSPSFIVTLMNGEAKNMQGLSEAKQKAINQMMAIAMDYHIKATNNPSFDLIDSIQETNDDYKTSMTKEQVQLQAQM